MMNFSYHRPTHVADALALLSAHPDARVLAGGQSLLAAMKLRLAAPSDLIDLGVIPELKLISLKGDTLTIGAMATHAEVANSNDVKRALPALAALAEGIGDRQVRNRGTLGGALANNDPAACYPAAVMGLNATIRTSTREIAADDFFRGMYETALNPGELIVAVDFPLPRRAAYVKFRHPASRFALVGVFVSESAAGVRVAVTGAAPSVFRVPEMEKALRADFKPEAIAKIKVSPDELNNDIHADAEYRAHLVTVIAQRAIRAALA